MFTYQTNNTRISKFEELVKILCEAEVISSCKCHNKEDMSRGIKKNTVGVLTMSKTNCKRTKKQDKELCTNLNSETIVNVNSNHTIEKKKKVDVTEQSLRVTINNKSLKQNKPKIKSKVVVAKQAQEEDVP